MKRRKVTIILMGLATMLMVGALLEILWGHYSSYLIYIYPFSDIFGSDTPCPTRSVCVPTPGKPLIAFSSNRAPYDHEIYVMNADGTCLTRLTNFYNRHVALEPRWSPDGTKILFELYFFWMLGKPFSDTELYTVTADGSQVIRLTRRGENWGGRWSPDGSKIVFLSNRDGYDVPYVMNADGSHETQLTDIEVPPWWSGCFRTWPAPSCRRRPESPRPAALPRR